MTELEILVEQIKEISGAFFPVTQELEEVTLTSRWYFGKVTTESEIYKRDKPHVVAKLAKLRKCSKVTIYRELKFFDMFPNIEIAPGVIDLEPVQKSLPPGKKLTWYTIANQVLVRVAEETQCRIPISRRANLTEAVDRIQETECRLITLHDKTGKRLETIELI